MGKLAQLRQEWEGNLANFEQSGLSQSAWCRQHGYPLHQLQYWRKKLSSDATSLTDQPIFAPVKLLRSNTASTASATSFGEECIKVSIGNITVDLPHSTSPTFLSTFVLSLTSHV